MKPLRVPLLKPGRYRLSDGRTVAYTKDDAKHVCNQGNKQIAAGLKVPLSWMHDPDAEPQYLSNTKDSQLHDEAWVAKGYFGDVVRYEMAPDGAAIAIVNVHTPKDADQFQRVGTVSPCLLNNWTDEKGVKWPGLTIMHVASTPKPIQRDLGKVANLSHVAKTKRHRELQLLSQTETTITPWSESMGDEKKDKTGKGGDFSKLVALMNENGMSVGDPSDMDQLMVGLKAHFDTKNGGSTSVDVVDEFDAMEDMDSDLDSGMEDEMVEGEEVNLSEGDYDDEDDTETVSPPMLMSHNFYKKAVELEKKDLTDRANVVAKKLGFDASAKQGLIDSVNAHCEKLSAVNLSHKNSNKVLDKNGDFKKGKIHMELETLERLQPQKFSKKIKLSHTALVSPPNHETADQSVQKMIEQRRKEHKLPLPNETK